MRNYKQTRCINTHFCTLPLLVSSALFTACGGGGGSSGGGSSAPGVTSQNPANNATRVLTNSTVSATFSEAIDNTSIDASSFMLDSTSPLPGTVSYDTTTNTATFMPTSSLSPGTTHTATLSTSITDTEGNGLTTAVSWSFTTEESIYQVSINTAGVKGNNESYSQAISANGQFVAFSSLANNLVANDTNAVYDIFVHDVQNATTTRVSVSSAGVEGNNVSFRPAISADGRYVTFFSRADNLVTGDTNSFDDVFVHDRNTGATTRVSVPNITDQLMLGTEATGGDSVYPAISADGRYVTYTSLAINLVTGDSNAVNDIFIHDRNTGSTTRLSVDSINTQSNGGSFGPSISNDGRYVAFTSSASNLVAGDTNATSDIFLHDTQNGGTTTRVSISLFGAQSNGLSDRVKISGDGRYVSFLSSATNLVINDLNAASDIFVRDTQSSTTTRVSVDSSGTEANDDSFYPSINLNGRYVTYISSATNLVADDFNGVIDVFVHDTQAGTTTRVSINATGTEGNLDSGNNITIPTISSDGRYVAFYSLATNLVDGNIGSFSNIFRALNPVP